MAGDFWSKVLQSGIYCSIVDRPLTDAVYCGGSQTVSAQRTIGNCGIGEIDFSSKYSTLKSTGPAGTDNILTRTVSIVEMILVNART